MRMLLHAMFPTDPFNDLVRSGKAGEILQKIVEDLKPEAIYFTEEDGMRAALMVVDLGSPSDGPRPGLFPRHQSRLAMLQPDLKHGRQLDRPVERRTRMQLGTPVSARVSPRPYHIRAPSLNIGAAAWSQRGVLCLPGT